MKQFLVAAAILSVAGGAAGSAVYGMIERAKHVAEETSIRVVRDAARLYLLQQESATDEGRSVSCREALQPFLEEWPKKRDGKTEIGCSFSPDGSVTVTGTDDVIVLR
ncbi:hypothetical protein MO973_43810 [Paenibacillus sp. TRM 82003]|nr:hypothetical protein [Paenibacillus sp. TRM 82003]